MPATQYDRGQQLFDPSLLAADAGHTFADNLTATAGGGWAGARPFTAAINRVTVVATVGDSVALPKAAGGQRVTVINAGANALQLYAAHTAPGDTLNGVSAPYGISFAAGKTAEFVSMPGAWFSVMSAVLL